MNSAQMCLTIFQPTFYLEIESSVSNSMLLTLPPAWPTLFSGLDSQTGFMLMCG